MEKGKRGLLACFVIGIFLISFTSAFTLNEDIPQSVQLKCDESYNREFVISAEDDENITITPGIIADDNMNLGLTLHPATNHLYVSLFQNGECMINDKQFSFSINDVQYNIAVNITEDIWHLDNVTLKEGEMISIGGVAEFSLLTSGDSNILFLLDGCEEDVEDFMDVGEFYEATCDGEILRFEVIDSYLELQAGRISVSSSESGWNIIKGKSDIGSGAECELGLDTLGARVRRGNLLGINTINVIDNKKVPGVSVTILDQTGELSPINGQSSNTGFFNERLHEEYEEDIIVQLEEEGCEPSNQVIKFENTYNDYVDNKNKEKNSKTLNFTISESYKTGETLVSKVINLLGDSVEDAEVKLTSPTEEIFNLKTDFDGSFNFTFEESGDWKIQAGKEDYSSSELIQFEVESSEFIVVALVDGEEKYEFNKGDKIQFEIRDENDSVIERDIVGYLDDEPIVFNAGVSEKFKFSGEVELEIPEESGFEDYDMTLREVESGFNFIYIVVVIIVLIIIAIVVGTWKTKLKKKPNSPKGVPEVLFDS